MMRIGILVLGLAILGLALAQIYPILTDTGPRLSPVIAVIDFGDLTEGEVSERILEFENTGDETLSVFQVRGSCGCTATLVDQRNVEPGEMGQIKVTFNSLRKVGRLNQNITIRSNDHLQPNLRIPITALVRPAPLNLRIRRPN